MDSIIVYAEKLYHTSFGETLHRFELWIFLALLSLGAFIFFYASSKPQFKEQIAQTSKTKILLYCAVSFASSIAGMVMIFDFLDRVRQP